MSYSKRAHTFRTTVGDCPAARARLGSPSFVGFNKTRPVPAGLVFEHVPQHRPTCIENGFSHPSSLGKLCGADIADNDKLVFASYLSARFVELIFARVCNLGVDRLDAALVTGALCDGKRGLILAIVLQGRDGVAIAARRECLQSEVYSNLAIAGWQIVGNLALKTNIPATTGVLSKAARLDGVGNIPRFPEMEFALEVDNVRAVEFHSTLDKWQPAEGALGAAAGAETRSMACGVARDYKLLAYLTDRIGVQPEISGAPCSQLDKIEVRGPAPLGRTGLVIALDLALDFATVVPDKIDRPRMVVEMLPDRRVLDPVLESQNHRYFGAGNPDF